MDYSEAEEEPEFPEIEEEFVPQMDEGAGDDFGDLALDSLALDDSEAVGVSGDDTEADAQDIKQKKEKKDGFLKRIFGNIITEQSAEEEAKEREKEQADAEEKKAAKEEKKQQTAEEKAAKAEQKRRKEKSKEKAEQAMQKQREKKKRKRLKAEREANEVVGRINPVGALRLLWYFRTSLCSSCVWQSGTFLYDIRKKCGEFI